MYARILMASALTVLVASTALAETNVAPESTAVAAMQATDSTAPAVAANVVLPGTVPGASEGNIGLQYWKPRDQSGLNMFEAPKGDGGAYEGKRVYWGFGFAQQFQGLKHRNTADPKMQGTPAVNVNQLIEIGNGFNNANANLYLDAQIARGMRVALTAYLSSRHHNETWVKDGYLQIDDSPIDNEKLHALMKHLTLRVGHFEINYGDAHFRRSDNGNAFFNPFVGNLIMDAFTTEIGAEAYGRCGGLLGMVGVTGGEIRGQVQKPRERSASYLGKLGYDRQVTQNARVRLTGSFYTNKQAVNSTLYSGSRAGSRYYSVLENIQSAENTQAWSGDLQPGFRNRVTAWVINPFVKYRGLELFGNIEQAKGRTTGELTDRTWNHYAGEAIYRLMQEKLYVGGRYNVADGTLAGIAGDLKVERVQAAGGWFVTPNLLAKLEYVREDYKNFPVSDIRNGGRFDGFMVEGAVNF
ncbi:MAG TPA: hypothetical protein VJY35_03880 [Candidatus Eisenbacteria bacterium]|nr:hypothetical protein [Candidatus Eisenbacteria bacterium]